MVTDRGVAAAGLLDTVLGRSRSAVVFDGVEANPTEANCLAGLAVCRARGCDGLVALGGGSPIDTCKAIRLLATHGGSLADYDITAGGSTRITANLPPMLAVPTTAGTGSEAGRGSLIQLPQTVRKTAIISPYLLPSVAICDPELTLGLPPLLTAGTGMDALTHAIESYISKTFHPICDGIALEGLKHISKGLEASVRNGADLAARTELMLGALLAGISFHKGLGAVHALSHSLGSEGRVHHGTLNAILLPHVLRFNRPGCDARLAELAARMGVGRAEDAPGHLITLTELLLARLGLPRRLAELGELDPNLIPRYAERALRDHCLATNPRTASQTPRPGGRKTSRFVSSDRACHGDAAGTYVTGIPCATRPGGAPSPCHASQRLGRGCRAFRLCSCSSPPHAFFRISRVPERGWRSYHGIEGMRSQPPVGGACFPFLQSKCSPSWARPAGLRVSEELRWCVYSAASRLWRG